VVQEKIDQFEAARILAVSQSDELRVPQPVYPGPFDLGSDFRLHLVVTDAK
jgi:hypothetical protein